MNFILKALTKKTFALKLLNFSAFTYWTSFINIKPFAIDAILSLFQRIPEENMKIRGINIGIDDTAIGFLTRFVNETKIKSIKIVSAIRASVRTVQTLNIKAIKFSPILSIKFPLFSTNVRMKSIRIVANLLTGLIYKLEDYDPDTLAALDASTLATLDFST